MNVSPIARTIWLAVGTLSLGCGIAGAVLPLLPTTPFLLLSVYAFARSSPRLHRWLINHSQFGPMILNWQQHGAIDRRTKRIALTVIVLTPLVTWFIGAPLWVVVIQIVVLLGISIFIVTRSDAKPNHNNELNAG